MFKAPKSRAYNLNLNAMHRSHLFLSRIFVLPSLFSIGFLPMGSCSKDDGPPPEQQNEHPHVEDPEQNENPTDFIVEAGDYQTLKELYHVNPNNTLGWAMDDKSMQNWAGVTQQNGRVVTLNLNNKLLSTLTVEFGTLDKLTQLTIGDNRISTLSDETESLTDLTHINLENNALKGLLSTIVNWATISKTVSPDRL